MRFALLTLVLLPLSAFGQTPNYTRTDDVIYGRKFGTALTMDVFAPKEKPNGAGIVFCISGGWFSSKESINPGFLQEFVNRGYVVFAVLHGSQPKYSIPEVLEDQHRALKYIRTNAKKYGVDPERLGISGASAGGHLSLMQGCAPKLGDPAAKDPVNKASSKVAAVACFFPPTDFLNYGNDPCDRRCVSSKRRRAGGAFVPPSRRWRWRPSFSPRWRRRTRRPVRRHDAPDIRPLSSPLQMRRHQRRPSGRLFAAPFAAGLNAVAPAPICEQQIGQMVT